MARKRKADIFDTGAAPTHIFRAGDVARILGIEKWRLEKFLTGKHYHLSPSGQLGKGQGSWRLFSHQDIYRLGIATLMVQDGFSAKFVSFVLREIEDAELLETDERGEAGPPDVGVYRTKKGPSVHFTGGRSTAKPYYVLRLGELIRDIGERALRLQKETRS
jgi:hypothetical protein